MLGAGQTETLVRTYRWEEGKLPDTVLEVKEVNESSQAAWLVSESFDSATLYSNYGGRFYLCVPTSTLYFDVER